ncbi:chitin synthase 1 isoform X2 [Periophthalmus magnuspinnatus]|uniref:chitin synthase 1 isoform X2 n=1 Tax=Periophthalmus magnuspinnatus TaxID=409849 RepID=UPI00145BC555|nr:chitin synthase 1 isoform X2 [Periophthalmus magnuspinnatus]
MDDLKTRATNREDRHKGTWDPFLLNPAGAEKEQKRTCFRIAQYLVTIFVGMAVLTSAVVAKGSLLVLSTLASPNSMRTSKEQQFYMLMLVFCLVFPNFLAFLKSLWRCAFKSFVTPNFKTMCFICAIECLVSLGTSVLVLVVMPQFDVLTNLFISGGVCLVPAILQIVFRLQAESWKIVFPLCSLVFTIAGYFLLGLDYYARVTSFVDRQDETNYMYIGVGVFSSLLISLCWWENPVQASNRMEETLRELEGFRDFVSCVSSLLRIIIIGGVYLLYYKVIAKTILWEDFIIGNEEYNLLQVGLGLLFLQAFCAAACHWFGVVACKIHAVRLSFALPVCCAGPSVVLLGMILFITESKTLAGVEEGSITEFCGSLVNLHDKNTTSMILLEITRSICRTSLNSHYEQWPFAMLALEGLCMWCGFLTCTHYVWKTKVQRIERTSQLFVRRLYESCFIDLSLLLNTKMKVARAKNQDNQDQIQNCVIYLCATMWHETYDEMLKIVTSMFRLDRYRGNPVKQHADCFNFECHIYMDDAFMDDKETGKRLVNSYVSDLINVVIEVYRVFTHKEPDEVSIIETPYGGRLVVVLPQGNMLFAHLKDKKLIRNKKRWSQIMYLYYLLGWKGYLSKNPHKLRYKKESMRSLDRYSDLSNHFIKAWDDIEIHNRKDISDDNTYILALDGDTDFQPKAVILLVDRLRMYDSVGAACGRIHPTGMGPMVWYQKFEYAVGHWLQKTAEHVFGSVLCSPGCFSLFRGSALMDDNVLKRYTTKATRASEYVQYDQGEDRWLCTLLLQQGWRVEYNAASDAYTNSPQEFKEFYNQRRRWGPSTLANTLDLLHSGSETVKRNTSISRLYIFYQMFTVGSSILGPASVTLMIAGAFQFVFQIAGTLSIIVASIPPVFYIIICFITKANTQITIAGIMSVLYAFLMTASFFSIIGDMVMQGTFLTPTGVFLVSMTIMYMVTAILHPEEFGLIIYGLMYFICIPSGYLLLTIYSLVNMNNVSWGTRETSKGEAEAKTLQNTLCDKNCQLCCWDMKIQVTQEVDNVMFQKMVGHPALLAPPLLINPQSTTQETALLQQKDDSPEETIEKEENKPDQDIQPKYNRGASISSDYSSDKKSLLSSDFDDDDDDENYSSLAEKKKFPIKDWVNPVKKEFLTKLTTSNMAKNLKEQIRYVLLPNEDELYEQLEPTLNDILNSQLSRVGPEDIPSNSQLDELRDALTRHARQILKSHHKKRLEKKVKSAIEKTLKAPQVEQLNEDEKDFWDKLLERYLTPINDSKEHQDEVSKELKSLRNKAVFLYFIINILWVVATFFLQAIGNDVISIKIPKYFPNGTLSDEYLKVEPLSLMFLLSFAVLLLVQFLAMLYHRVYTLIHIVSYRSKEKDYIEKATSYDPDRDDYIEENIGAIELTVTSDDLQS